MKKTLLFVLVALLTAPAAFCTTSLLRLERADSPDGVWEQVPSNTLPITEEGAFLDTYESPTGYYQMRIDPGEDWGFPLSMPLEDVPGLGVNIAQGLLDDLRDIDGDNSWEDAVLGPTAFPMYTPGIDGPAYMEFVVLSPQPEPPDLPFENTIGRLSSPPSSASGFECSAFSRRGYILVSLTEEDFPIVEYATDGGTRTECLRNLARSSAVRVVKITEEVFAAENSKGELVAYHGAPPVYYPDDILELCDKEFEGQGDEQGDKNPDPPPFKGEPYKSYEEFKNDYLESKRFQEARKRRAEAAETEWDIILARVPEVIYLTYCEETTILEEKEVKDIALDDPELASFQIQKLGVLMHGKKVGDTTMHVTFADGRRVDYILVVSEKPLSPEQPTWGWTSWEYWWADDNWAQRCYRQEWGGGCWSGCGATAWAMIYGWWDRSGRCTALIDGTAPWNNNAAVRDCIWYVVDQIGTYCVGSSGATNPWNMWKGKRWATHQGCGYSYYYKWTSPCFGWTWNGPRNLAIDEIKNNDRPVIIGTGCASAHYPVAYGYKYRRYRTPGVTWARQRRFRCNMGWSACQRQWKNADGIWFAIRTTFW